MFAGPSLMPVGQAVTLTITAPPGGGSSTGTGN